MENRHATKLEEMEKRQHDIQERLTQMMEMLTSPKREKWIDDDPNLQERPKHWKNDNDERGIHICSYSPLLKP